MPCRNDVYPGKAQQFPEALLKNPEKLRASASAGTGSRRLLAAKF
jgi:hypothetical protein